MFTVRLRALDSVNRWNTVLRAALEKGENDPHHPLPRSKGEKARNKRRRGGR